MKTIVDKNTGKVLYVTTIELELVENEIEIDGIISEEMENPYFNFDAQKFYDKI